MRIQSLLGSISLAGGTGVLPPQRIFQGFLTSNQTRLVWWPPADGTEPDGYNIYRNGIKQNTALIVPRALSPGVSIPYPFYTETQGALTPSTTYNYTVTSVYGTTESVPTANFPVTTLSGTPGNSAVAPPTDPSTYLPAYALPTQVTTATQTVWTATQNTAAANTGSAGAGTSNGVNSNLSVGCSLSYALANAQAGDVIVLSSGLTYTSNGAINAHAFNQSNGSASGFIYIISDQDPGFNSSGRLPPYSYVTLLTHVSFQTSGSASIAPGAQSLTLSDAFTGKTGWYKTVFSSSVPSGMETRQALYQQGSTSVVWNVGLIGTCTGSFLAGISNHVTPWDAGLPIGAGNVVNPAPVMPTIQFTQANGSDGIRLSGTNVRMVGINVQPVASQISPALNTCVTITGTGIMLDRCVMGRDNTASNRSFFGRVLATSGVNVVVHQCYLYGADNGPGGSDSQAISMGSRGPICVQNCYLEGVSEVFICGGSWVAENAVPHDVTVRYNWSHKQSAWQQLTNLNTQTNNQDSISRRVKNHFELKCAQRVNWYGNIIQNNSSLQASQGQGGRAFVMTPRDQTSLTSVRGIANASWSSLNGGTVTINVQLIGPFVLAPGTLFTTTISNCPVAGYNGTFVATSTRASSSADGGAFTYPLAVNPGASAGAFTGFTNPPQCGGMWQNITDVDIHDNQVYGTASGPYFSAQIDYNWTLYTTKVTYHNNLEFINPAFTDDAGTLTFIRGSEIQGLVADVSFKNNTIIMIPANTGYALTGAAQTAVGMNDYQSGSTDLLEDHWTITDNIIDGKPANKIDFPGGTQPPHYLATGGVAIQFSFNQPTFTWNKNLMPIDASTGSNAYPGGGPTGPTTYNPIAYANIGMASFPGNAVMPKTPADYNVVTGTYLTAGTTGGPLGCTFPDALANDRFPRTFWQVIQPGSPSGAGTSYSNSTFQTNAAKFNIVNPSPYMGIEQDMGNTTFQNIFLNIKNLARANGITNCRCIHYVMSSEQSTVGGTGNGGTYTVWSNGIQNANWWLRTSWPAGSIVTFDANSGVFATTPANTVLGLAPFAGKTFAQSFWAHYDGALRTGSATTLGYAANKSLVTNTLLDGYQMDNVFCTPRSTGSWQMNTTSVAAGSALGAQLIQQGQALQIAAMRAINADMILLCNADYYIHSTTNFSTQVTLDPSQTGIMDVVYCQNVIGTPSSIEGQGITSTQMLMQNLIAAEAQMAPTGTLIMEQAGRARGVNWSTLAQSTWVAADWQAARFGCSMTCMRNWHYAINNQNNYSPTATPYFMDETTAQGGVYGWLGHPTEAPQTAPRTSGVWWRKFQNGVVFMNPAGSGPTTLTLSSLGLSAGLKAISSNGFGDTTINNGATVTTITLQPRDGRFLIGPP